MSSNYRADHVGSFLRPADLLDARSRAIPAEQLHALEDQHINRILEKQKDLGFNVFTDGEFRRSSFMSDFTDAVEGFDFGDAVPRQWDEDKEKGGDPHTPSSTAVSSISGIVTSRLRRRKPLTGHELPFLRAHAPGPIKITLPSATQFPAISFRYGVTDQVYRDPFVLLEEITSVMVEEIRSLVSSGISYLQIDAPRYSYYLDPKWCRWMETELRVDPEAMLSASLQADNTCFAAARQPGVTVAIHLCRGNNRSHWYAAGGYDAIAERFFHELNVDRFLLEYDDERSGSFEPLRYVPEGRTVVLGLVSSKRPALEQKEDLLRRIDQASKALPLEQLALSPQCGFASTMEGNHLTESDQWAKLSLVAETAREVWG
ncbi:MAG TPA: cobalamin-independent methionine synthase II family protein [Acidobacteriaceae bacterium]|jgi:5-methyltetrahydropteroyltriglutamate--homocysteine methyltransferase|nr:cobalamin-independent methionine synthase II family protein [Acidobacteriaceae bacterium]